MPAASGDGRKYGGWVGSPPDHEEKSHPAEAPTNDTADEAIVVLGGKSGNALATAAADAGSERSPTYFPRMDCRESSGPSSYGEPSTRRAQAVRLGR